MESPTHIKADRRFRFSLTGIFVLALLLRLLHIWQIRDAPVFDMRLGDSAVYHDWALGIAAGNWIGDGVFWYAPLYPFFLGSVYAVFGAGGWAVRVVQAVLGAASCVLLAGATRRLFGSPPGILAGLILALYAPAIFYDGLIHKPGLVLFLLSTVVWIVSGGVKQPTTPTLALALGAVTGLMILARENTLLFVPVLLAWLALEKRPSGRRRFVPPLAFLLGLSIALAPVALRNRIAVGEFQLTAANFGDNFYKGNNEYTDGTYVSLVPLRGSPEFERRDAVEIAEQETGRALTPSEVSRFWTAKSLDYIRSAPADWLKLMARKLYLVWHSVELADTEDIYSYASWSTVVRSTLPVFHLGLLAPLALLGLWVTWDHRRALYPFYAMLALYPASVVLFYVFGRYRFPVVALLVPFAAAGIVGAARFLRTATRPRQLAVVATVVLALVIVNWPTGTKERVRATTHYNIGVWLGRQPDRWEQAIPYYEEALRLRPESAGTLYNLGNALKRQGNLEQAEARYREALRYMPELADAHNNLARLVEARGSLGEAVEHYRQAIEYDPGHWEAHSNLGLALARQGRLDEAQASLMTAVQILPADPVLHFNLGNILYRQGRAEEAVSSYREALALNPESARAHSNLGSALVALGRIEEAIVQFREALRLEPDHAAARANLQAITE